MSVPPAKSVKLYISGIITAIALTVVNSSTRTGLKVGVVGIVCRRTPLKFIGPYKLAPYTLTALTCA